MQAILGIAVVVLAAISWQLVELSGRIEAALARLDSRLAAIEKWAS